MSQTTEAVRVDQDVQAPYVPNRRTRRSTRFARFQLGSRVASSNVIDMRNGTSLVASAQRIIQTKISGAGTNRKTESWMIDAWTMFDLVGELHFLSNTLAKRASRARFFVGTVNNGVVTELPEATAPTLPGQTAPEAGTAAPAAPQNPQDKKAQIVFDSLGDGFLGVQEIVERAFLNQFVVGACYLVGAPPEVWKGETSPRQISTVPIGELVWRTLAVTEFTETDSTFELRQVGSQQRGKAVVKIPKSAAYVISLWNAHPADSSVPDSPVRATLPVLRELVGLTQYGSAQIDSRLAGAGMLIMRSSASRAIKRSLGLPEDDPRDPFTEMLIDAMVTPIGDRDSASAVVPYVVTIPDDTKTPELISFSTPLDVALPALREEAIRRIALSLDAPAALLLGTDDSNHWSAWLTQSETVDSHISPTLALIARALTTEFLRPVLRANGLSVAQAQNYAVWFDTSELVVQANQGTNAQALYQLGLLSDETTRRANGFDESDAPKKTDNKEAAIDIVKTMVEANPGLMNRPGLDVMVEQIEALLNGEPQSGLAASAAAESSSGSSQIAPAPAASKGAPAPQLSPAVAQAGAPAAPWKPKDPSRAPIGALPGGAGGASGVGIPNTQMPAAANAEAFGTWDEVSA